MAGDEPPYLPVGTEVSAKYRGAFCEAKVKKVVRSVKCRVHLKDSTVSLVVTDESIKGLLKLGALVEVRHPENGSTVEANISSMKDCSMYTVVFDDADERTLRRTQLCLKGERHFIESETLDNLPLSNPEHFGTPVMQGKKVVKRTKRESASYIDSSYDDEDDDDNDSSSNSDTPPKRVVYKGRHQDLVGKVMYYEQGGTEKKRAITCFPVLVVLPDAHATERKTKDHLLVRSFKDTKFLSMLRKELKDFTRDIAIKNEDKLLKNAMEKALLYYDSGELPISWIRDELLGPDDDEVAAIAESSDDEPNEEKDHFVAQLYKFMDDRGTPMNKGPSVGNKDLNLYRLFNVVQNLGGYNRVTNQMKWRLVYSKMGLPPSNNASHQIKNAYKKYLHAFEDFYRKLGSSMGTISRPGRVRHTSGRTLFREKDPILSPKEKAKIKEAAKEEKQKEESELEKDKSPPKQIKETEKSKMKESERLKMKSATIDEIKTEQMAPISPHVKEAELVKKDDSVRPQRDEKPSRGKDEKQEKPDILLGKKEIKLDKKETKLEKNDVKMEKRDVKVVERKDVKTTEKVEKKPLIKVEKKDIKTEKKEIKLEKKDAKIDKNEVKVEIKEVKLEKKLVKTDKKDGVEKREIRKSAVDDKPASTTGPQARERREWRKPIAFQDEFVTVYKERKDRRNERASIVDETKSKKDEVKDKKEESVDKKDTVISGKKDVISKDIKKETSKEKEPADIPADAVVEEDTEFKLPLKKGRKKLIRADESEKKDVDILESKKDTSTPHDTPRESKRKPQPTMKVKAEAESKAEVNVTVTPTEIPTVIKTSTEEVTDDADDKSGSGPGFGKDRYSLGTKLRVKYGRGKHLKVYEAKVVEHGKTQQYLVHYAGWNNRYDEWIRPDRIVTVIHKSDGSKKALKLKSPSPMTILKKRGRPPLTPSTDKKTPSDTKESNQSIKASVGEIKDSKQPIKPNVSERKDSNQPMKSSIAETKDSKQPMKPSIPERKDSNQPMKSSIAETKDSKQPMKPSIPERKDSKQPMKASVSETKESKQSMKSSSSIETKDSKQALKPSGNETKDSMQPIKDSESESKDLKQPMKASVSEIKESKQSIKSLSASETKDSKQPVKAAVIELKDSKQPMKISVSEVKDSKQPIKSCVAEAIDIKQAMKVSVNETKDLKQPVKAKSPAHSGSSTPTSVSLTSMSTTKGRATRSSSIEFSAIAEFSAKASRRTRRGSCHNEAPDQPSVSDSEESEISVTTLDKDEDNILPETQPLKDAIAANTATSQDISEQHKDKEIEDKSIVNINVGVFSKDPFIAADIIQEPDDKSVVDTSGYFSELFSDEKAADVVTSIDSEHPLVEPTLTPDKCQADLSMNSSQDDSLTEESELDSSREMPKLEQVTQVLDKKLESEYSEVPVNVKVIDAIKIDDKVSSDVTSEKTSSNIQDEIVATPVLLLSAPITTSTVATTTPPPPTIARAVETPVKSELHSVVSSQEPFLECDVNVSPDIKKQVVSPDIKKQVIAKEGKVPNVRKKNSDGKEVKRGRPRIHPLVERKGKGKDSAKLLAKTTDTNPKTASAKVTPPPAQDKPSEPDIYAFEGNVEVEVEPLRKRAKLSDVLKKPELKTEIKAPEVKEEKTIVDEVIEVVEVEKKKVKKKNKKKLKLLEDSLTVEDESFLVINETKKEKKEGKKDKAERLGKQKEKKAKVKESDIANANVAKISELGQKPGKSKDEHKEETMSISKAYIPTSPEHMALFDTIEKVLDSLPKRTTETKVSVQSSLRTENCANTDVPEMVLDSSKPSSSQYGDAVLEITPPTTPEHESVEPLDLDSDQLSRDVATGLASMGMLSSIATERLAQSASASASSGLVSGGESPPAGDGSTMSNETFSSGGNVLSSESSHDLIILSSISGKRKREQVDDEDEPGPSGLTPVKKRKHGRKHKHKHHDSDSDDRDGENLGDLSDSVFMHRGGSHSPYKSTDLLALMKQQNMTPRPPKYNFNLEEGQDLEGEKRITFLLEKIKEIRKIYMGLKSEVATIDRRRKRHRRKERENSQASASGELELS